MNELKLNAKTTIYNDIFVKIHRTQIVQMKKYIMLLYKWQNTDGLNKQNGELFLLVYLYRVAPDFIMKMVFLLGGK